jgi:hypothetical protein
MPIFRRKETLTDSDALVGGSFRSLLAHWFPLISGVGAASGVVVMALLSLGCSAAAPESKASRYLVTPVVGTVGSMAFGNHTETHGMAVLERSTGDVFFCQSRCAKIANLPPVQGQALSIHAGASDDFLFVDDSTGQVTSCSVDMANKKNVFVFESGKCQSMPLRPKG